MRRHASAVALAAFAALALASCSHPVPKPPVPTEADTRAQLQAQSDAWDKAIVAKDSVGVVVNMSDDFRQIDGRGDVYDKKAFVADILSPDLTIDPYTVEDFDIRLYGDAALLCGRTRMTGKYKSEPFTSHYRYIDVYARQGGVWKVVNVQISRIPPPEPGK